MNKLRILLVEDHETVREGLKRILGAEPDMEIVAEACDGYEALKLAQAHQPDITLMDISMPGLNGLKATEKISQCCPKVKVIALTRHTEESYLQQLISVGVAGYVLKQSPAVDMLRAIRVVASGGKYLDPTITAKVMGAYGERPFNSPRGVMIKLSERESETLRFIAWGYSNKEIASKLNLSVKTIEVHKANGMKKLGMKSRIDIVRYAVLRGWLEET